MRSLFCFSQDKHEKKIFLYLSCNIFFTADMSFPFDIVPLLFQTWSKRMNFRNWKMCLLKVHGKVQPTSSIDLYANFEKFKRGSLYKYSQYLRDCKITNISNWITTKFCHTGNIRSIFSGTKYIFTISNVNLFRSKI